MLKISDKTDKIVEHFTLFEMSNQNDNGLLPINMDVVKFANMMEELRLWFNQPLVVNSWYRTAGYNKKVGGASNSMHLQALACDFTRAKNPPSEWTVSQWQAVMIKWYQICQKYGIKGGSVEIAPTWVHVDVRERPKFAVMNHKDKQSAAVWIPSAYRTEWGYTFI